MATFKSDLINANAPGKFGTYPQTAFGSVTIPSGTTLTQDDIIDLCNISPNVVIEDFYFDLPALDSGTSMVTTLQDDAGNKYVTNTTKGRAAAKLSMANDLDAGILGMSYGVARKLRFVVGVTAGAALGADAVIRFKVCFSPL